MTRKQPVVFHAVGIITVDGEMVRLETEIDISPPPGKGIAWALTQAVAYFNHQADEGTEHHGVWCYPGGGSSAGNTEE